MTKSTTAATKDLEKATLFNEYFYSVLTTSNHDSPVVDSATHAAAITNIDISVTEVYTALASLAIDPSKSPGIDGIGSNILKLGTQALCVPLHHLFKLCLSHCSIPSEWKIHQIIPIFKAGDRSCVNNYRSISLLSCTSYLTKLLVS